MDKLEKALQKARIQREAQLQKQTAEQDSRARVADLPPPEPVQSDSVNIHEGYMERYHVIAHQPRSREADLFRLLRTQVLQIMQQNGYRTLGITSANYGDGKTTISLNLAFSIAMDLKQTVLLADMDLRKPSVTEYLGIEAPFGISEYFTDNVPISKCLLRSNFDRLNILPAGKRMDRSSEILGSPQIAQLSKELRSRYEDRIIIYDLPPCLAQDDPIAFLPQVEAVLLVVNDGVTRVTELKQSMNLLSGAHVIGTVLNHSAPKKKQGSLARLSIFLEKTYERAKRLQAS